MEGTFREGLNGVSFVCQNCGKRVQVFLVNFQDFKISQN